MNYTHTLPHPKPQNPKTPKPQIRLTEIKFFIMADHRRHPRPAAEYLLTEVNPHK